MGGKNSKQSSCYYTKPHQYSNILVPAEPSLGYTTLICTTTGKLLGLKRWCISKESQYHHH